MPVIINPFERVEGERIKLTEEQRKEIKRLYSDVLEDVRKQIRWIEHKKDVSSVVRRRYLESIKSDVEKSMQSVDRKTERLVRTNMDKMAALVMENNQTFLSGMGFKGYMNDPKLKADVVSRIVSGKLYENKWSLSSAIWGDNEQKLKEINNIVAKGIAANKSTYDIAKDLERYVNPNARKTWEWNKMFPGSRRKIDYNAQRLARTMVSHAYEESLVAATKNNPFVLGYRWITSGGHRVCPLCIERESTDAYGLGAGVFPKDALPLDHPNGMCTFDVVMSMSMEESAEAIADWYLGEGDKKLNKSIDKFVKDLRRF